MEVNTQRSLQDDQTSECGTFGSNYCPSSQSRKISIGIMTDSVAKKRLEPLREEKVAEQRENIGGLKRRVRETGETKQTEAPQQASSPWRSTKSKSLVSEPPQRRNGTSNVRSVGGRLKKQRREIDAPVTHSVQFFTGQTPMSHFSGGKQETFKGFTYKRKGSKNGDSQEFTFANAKEGAVPDKVVAEDKNEEGRTECLKMKLWEILGKVSSPKSQPSDSRAREKNADNSKSDQGQVHKTDADGKPLRNSDTIETDSENPDLNLTKPVTRSLTRRRGLTKVRPEKKRGAPSSNNRQKLEENNAFSFAEGLLQKGNAKANGGSSIFLEKKGYKNLSSFRPRSNCFSENNGTGADQKGCSVKAVHVNGGPSTSTRNNSPRKSSIIEPSNVGFSHDNADEIQEKTRRSETLISADRTSLLGNKMKNIFRSPSRDVTENSVSKTGNKEREDHQLLREDSQKSLHKQRSKEQEDITSTKGEKKGQQEESIGPSLKNIVDTNEDFASPTLKFRTPSLTPSPTFKPRSEKTNEAPNSSALKDTGFLVKNIRSFRTLQASKAASVSHSESSDDEAAEFKNSPQTNVTLPQGKVNEENYLSDSSSEDKDSSEEGSPIRKGQRKGDISCPVIRPVERSTFFFSPVKDFRSHEGSRDKYDPISPFLKGTGIGEIDCAEELLLSEQNQRDELERVVMLFALSLEKFRNKMRMATRNKSSDILLSVSEEISLQLQNVKSQIQKDLGKLAGFSKLKRKQIETTFQEQEEKLKMIHDKFKEDILRHLQDCKSSVEDLEEHQTVISEAVKKQKASHQKLLMQVEEAIGERLNDAQRSIESVHKMSKPDFEGKKMLFAGDDKWYMDTGKKATSTDRLGRRHVKDHMGTREVHAFAPTFSQTELKLHGNSVIGRSYTSQSNSTYRGFFLLVKVTAMHTHTEHLRSSSDDKMNMATSDQLIGMTRSDPVMELLWENGQVFARGLSSNPSCVTYPPSNMKFRAKNDENMFGSRTRRLDHYSGQEECSKLQNSTQQDGHGGLFPGLYQNDFNLFFENTRNFDGVDSQVVPVCKNGSSRNGSKLNPQLTVPELQNQETGSDRRGLGMQSFSIPETLLIADNKSRSGLGISAPEKMRSNVVLEPAICAKDAKSFKNRPDYHKMSAKMKFVGEPPKEAPHDEQSQVGRENTNFQYFPDKLLPVQASSSAKKVKETSRYQKIATTSMCSRASNDMACSSPRRRHEENDLTTSPSNNIEEEKTSSYIEAYQRGHSKRKRNTEVHNMSERKRRAKINKKMRELQELIPNSDKVDKASMLDQAIEYLKNLQLQIQIMQMARSHFTQPMMFPSGMQQIQAPQLGPLFASLGTGMHMGSFGCNPAMYTASSLLGISGQMMPITFSHPPFMSFTGGSSILPNFFPRLPTPGEFLASASLLRSKVSTHDSNSGNDGNDFNSKMKTSSRS